MVVVRCTGLRLQIDFEIKGLCSSAWDEVLSGGGVVLVVVVCGSVREGFRFVLHKGALLYKMGWVTCLISGVPPPPRLL